MFRCSQLGTRVAKLSQELKEEQEMNRCLRANQTQLQSQLAEEERKGKENGEVPENSLTSQSVHVEIGDAAVFPRLEP